MGENRCNLNCTVCSDRPAIVWCSYLVIYYRIGPPSIDLLINGTINFGLALFLVRAVYDLF